MGILPIPTLESKTAIKIQRNSLPCSMFYSLRVVGIFGRFRAITVSLVMWLFSQ